MSRSTHIEAGNDNCESFSEWLSYQDKLCFD